MYLCSAYELGRRGLTVAHVAAGAVMLRPEHRVRGQVRVTNDRPVAPVVRPRRRREIRGRAQLQGPVPQALLPLG